MMERRRRRRELEVEQNLKLRRRTVLVARDPSFSRSVPILPEQPAPSVSNVSPALPSAVAFALFK